MSSGSGQRGTGPDRLGDFWDALVAGQPPPTRAVDLDPALVDSVHRVRALDAARPPTAAFVAGLERALMETTGQPVQPFRVAHPGPAAPRPTGTRPGTDLVRPLPLPLPLLARLHRPRPFPHVATAALLLLTLAGILVAPGGHRVGTGGLPSVAGSPTGAPPAAADVPAPEECRIAPRTSVAGLVDDASPVASVPASTTLTGATADAATTAGVGGSVREWTACINGGDPARWLAFFSDDYVRFLAADGTGFTLDDRPSVGLVEFLERGPIPPPPAEQAPAPIVHDVRLLADGRVSAVIAPVEGAADPRTSPSSLLVFVRDGDRFLIDELWPVVEPGTPTFFRPGDEATVEQSVTFLSEEPTLSAASDRLRQGAVLRITGDRVEAGGDVWYPVEEPATDRTGYVLVTAIGPRPVTTPGLVDQAWSSVPIPVDAEGVLADEPDALAEVRAALHDALDRYDGRCRVAVASVIGPEAIPPIGLSGTRLAAAIADRLDREFPDLFAGTDFEVLVDEETPEDRVDLRLYFFAGCKRAATPAA